MAVGNEYIILHFYILTYIHKLNKNNNDHFFFKCITALIHPLPTTGGTRKYNFILIIMARGF